MKRMKKFASLLLAVAMVLAMAVNSLAAETETGTISIKNPVAGQKYTIYRILDLESYNKDAGAYSYKAASGWSEFINRTDIKGKYLNVDDQGYVTWIEKDSEGKDTDPAEFAKLAKTYAQNNNVGNQGTVTPDNEGDKVEFTGLDLGYYLVDSTLGTLCSLDTTNPTVEMEEKNAKPSNDKTVEEDSDEKYGKVDDADIGQVVNFKSTVTLTKGSENVVFHDFMTDGLTLDKTDGKIVVYTNEAMTTELDKDNYSINTAPGHTDEEGKFCTFEITFTQDYLNTLTENVTVYVKYSATVNSEAVIGGEGNENTSRLSYGDATNTKTTPGSTTKTYTWSFDVLKYGNSDEEKVLEGAQFVLLKNKTNDDDTIIEKGLVAIIKDGKLTEWSDVPAAGENGEVTWPEGSVVTTDVKGKIDIAGLDADTYYLREVKAPAGYNKLAEDEVVTIESEKINEGNAMQLKDNKTVTAKINNQSGTELPSTGGMGTTIFYVVGSVLLVGAAVLLITKKRMSNTN